MPSQNPEAAVKFLLSSIEEDKALIKELQGLITELRAGNMRKDREIAFLKSQFKEVLYFLKTGAVESAISEAELGMAGMR